MTRNARSHALLFTTLVVLGLLGSGIWLRLQQQSRDRAASEGQLAAINWPRVLTAGVEMRDVERHVRASGTAQPRAIAELRAEVQAAVRAVHVQIGDRVRAGTVLVELDDATRAAAYAQAEAAVVRDQADLDFAQFDFEAKRKLFDERHARDLGITETDYRRAQQAMIRAGAAVKVSQTALASATAELAHTVVVAPFDGVITSRDVDPGDLASVGGALVTVADIVVLDVVVMLGASDVSQIDATRPATMQLFSADETNAARTLPPGTVAHVDPVADSRGLFEIRIQVANVVEWPESSGDSPAPGYVSVYLKRVDPRPRPLPLRGTGQWPVGLIPAGSAVRVDVPLQPLKRALVVPEAAIVRSESDETRVVQIRRQEAQLAWFGQPEAGREERASHVFVRVLGYASGYAVLEMLAPPRTDATGKVEWRTVDGRDVPLRPGIDRVAISQQASLRHNEAVVVTDRPATAVATER